MNGIKDYINAQPVWRRPRTVFSLLLLLLIIVAICILGIVVATGGVWSVSSGFTYLSAHGFSHLSFDGKDMARLAIADVFALAVCWPFAYAAKRRIGYLPLSGTICGCLVFGVLLAFWVGQIDVQDVGWENDELIQLENAKAIIRSLISMVPIFVGLFIGVSRADKYDSLETRRILDIDIERLENRLAGLRENIDEEDLLNDELDEYEHAEYLKVEWELKQLYQQRSMLLLFSDTGNNNASIKHVNSG